MPDFLENAEESLTDRIARILDAFHATFDPNYATDLWPEKVYNSVVIARDGDGLWGYPYTDQGREVTWDNRVAAAVDYQDEDGTSLIGNAADEHLADVPPRESELEDETMTDETTGAEGELEEELEDAEATTTESGESSPDVETTEDTAPETNDADPRLANLLDMVDRMGGLDAVEASLSSVQANAEAARTGLVTQALASDRNTFSQEELDAMPIPTLEKLLASWTQNNYGPLGASAFQPNAADAELVDNSMPSLEA